MSMRFSLLSLALVALATTSLSRGADAPAGTVRPAPVTTTVSFSKFQYISDWNIFDAARVGRGSGEPSAPPVQTISLVGVIDYEKGLFALFNGSSSADSKAAKVGDAVANYTVQQITPQSVDLLRSGQHVTLSIGQQLRKRVGGDWEVGGIAATATSSFNPAAPAIPADASDLLKRLMEKRQQQLKQ